MGNPEDAFMIAPKVIYGLERAFLFLSIGEKNELMFQNLMKKEEVGIGETIYFIFPFFPIDLGHNS